jgi:serine/threonine protein kinase
MNSKVYDKLIIDLIQRLFDPNPKTRIDLTSLKKHPWYLGEQLNPKDYKR